MATTIVEYWRVQNTGWSAGVSWFDTGGTPSRPATFKFEASARQFVADTRWADKAVKWRLVHVQVATTPNQRVTTERFILVR